MAGLLCCGLVGQFVFQAEHLQRGSELQLCHAAPQPPLTGDAGKHNSAPGFQECVRVFQLISAFVYTASFFFISFLFLTGGLSRCSVLLRELVQKCTAVSAQADHSHTCE